MNSPSPPLLLVVDDDPKVLSAVARIGRRAGFDVHAVVTPEEGLEILDQHDVDVALVDQGLPRMLGIDLIARAREDHPNTDYVLFTGEGDAELGFQALKRGASDFVTKPVRYDWLMSTMRRGVQAKRLRDENRGLRKAEDQSAADRLLLGPSSSMEDVRRLVRRYGQKHADVLILGESGVGKEVCARALNAESGRRGRYVVKNCGAITESLAELELFGADPGSYTGMADSSKPHLGAFEMAEDGTVFLDEVGDLPLNIQVKLLRVLEGRAYQRIGSAKEQPFRGRVIAATNQPLEEMVRTKTFRADLLYRFPLRIVLPPLREHLEDVPILAWRFLSTLSREYEQVVEAITPEAMHCLQTYEWRRNNVRELRNVMLQAVLHAPGKEIRVEHLPERVRRAGGSLGPAQVAVGALSKPTDAPAQAGAPTMDPRLLDLEHAAAKEEAIGAFERWYLTHHLQQTEGNVSRAAEASGMKRPNFHRLMKRYGVDRPDGDGEQD